MLEAIHYHMSILAAITGVRVGFTSRRCMDTTGRLVFITAPIVTTWL